MPKNQSFSPMKKLIERIRNKEKEEKSKDHVKNVHAKPAKQQVSFESSDNSVAKPRDLFWDDYSDIGYC